MAGDVGEHIGILAGAPVLEIGVPVIPALKQSRLAHTKIPEFSLLEKPPGHQCAVVETLVILDTDDQTFFVGLFFYLLGLGILQHQWLNTAYVLVVLQGDFNGRVVKLVRQCDYHDILFGHLGHNFFEKFGKFLVGVGVKRRIRRKSLARISFLQG